MFNKFKQYLKIWKILTSFSLTVTLYSRLSVFLFLTGKFLRFTFFLIFLVLLLRQSRILGSYNQNQVLFFYLTFNMVDSLTQLLFREVYRFRQMVVEGRFDFILLQPRISLFRPLFGGADVLDLIFLLPITVLTIYTAVLMTTLSIFNIIIYLTLIANAMIITLAFHIIVLAVGILTTSVDHSILIYRDVTSMGRIPVDYYKEPLRSLLMFIIPVGVIVTIPAKALMGLLSVEMILFSYFTAGVFILFAVKLWKHALTRYT